MQQIGDYVIEQAGPGTLWRVRMAGDDDLLGAYNTNAEAKAAVKRFQAADKRRAA